MDANVTTQQAHRRFSRSRVGPVIGLLAAAVLAAGTALAASPPTPSHAAAPTIVAVSPAPAPAPTVVSAATPGTDPSVTAPVVQTAPAERPAHGGGGSGGHVAK